MKNYFYALNNYFLVKSVYKMDEEISNPKERVMNTQKISYILVTLVSIIFIKFHFFP